MTDDCTACGRDGADCSADPCPDVIADRGELFAVEMRARTIQVTADGPDEARRYAREDAGEFMGQWDYEAPEVSALDEGEEPADDAGGVSIEVEPTGVDGETHTFDATFRVVVEASNDDEALATARRLMGIAA